MNSVLRAADEVYRRYVSMNEGAVPPVKIIYSLGETRLNGLKLHPSQEVGMVAFGPAEHPLPVFVIREEDVYQVEIGDISAKFGF